MKKILSLTVASILLSGTFFSIVPAVQTEAAETKEKTGACFCRCRLGFCEAQQRHCRADRRRGLWIYLGGSTRFYPYHP